MSRNSWLWVWWRAVVWLKSWFEINIGPGNIPTEVAVFVGDCFVPPEQSRCTDGQAINYGCDSVFAIAPSYEKLKAFFSGVLMVLAPLASASCTYRSNMFTTVILRLRTSALALFPRLSVRPSDSAPNLALRHPILAASSPGPSQRPPCQATINLHYHPSEVTGIPRDSSSFNFSAVVNRRY